MYIRSGGESMLGRIWLLLLLMVVSILSFGVPGEIWWGPVNTPVDPATITVLMDVPNYIFFKEEYLWPFTTMQFVAKWLIEPQAGQKLSFWLTFNDDDIQIHLYDLNLNKTSFYFTRAYSNKRMQKTINLEPYHKYILTLVLKNQWFGWGTHFLFYLK